jgi:phage baseplate assembly protein W
MLELLLFTRPGERVNRPDFGCGLLDLLFGPNSPEIAAAANVTITAAVGRWLGDLIALTSLDVTADDSRLVIDLTYEVLATGAPAELRLAIGGPG